MAHIRATFLVMTKRINITLSDPQMAALKAEAARLGISVGELVRRVVDAWRDGEKR